MGWKGVMEFIWIMFICFLVIRLPRAMFMIFVCSASHLQTTIPTISRLVKHAQMYET